MKQVGKILVLLVLAANLLVIAGMWVAAFSTYVQPVKHPVQSCAGLVFPIFAVLNLLFFVFWLIVQRYRVSLVPLLAFAVCYPAVRAYLPFNLYTDELPQGTFRLLSYNVMGFDGCTKDDNGRNPILDYLQSSGADVLCLQEYATSTSGRNLRQHDIERALKDYPYFCIRSLGSGKSKSNRMALYSKYPILSARVLSYESQYNGSVCYTLRVADDTLTLINNHLESNKLTRSDKVTYRQMLRNPQRQKVEEGARMLLRKLAKASAMRAPQADTIVAEVLRNLPKGPVVVCGDFNDSPVSYTHRVMEKHLTDAFTQSGRGMGISYNQNGFYFRIDHIFVSPHLQSYNCRVDRSIKQSDHYPMQCELLIKPKP